MLGIVIAAVGAKALWLVYLWLLSTIIAQELSRSKGYGEKIGLAFGLLFTLVGTLVWLFWPPKPDSKWKQLGPFGREKKTDESAPQRTA
jgi:hypothetical protein